MESRAGFQQLLESRRRLIHALELEAKVLKQRYGRPGTVREQHFDGLLTLRGVQSLLCDPSSLANAIDGLAKFLEHLSVGKPSLEKRRDAIEVFGRALHFNLDLLSESTVRIGKIVYVNGHPVTCLLCGFGRSPRAAPNNSNCAVYNPMSLARAWPPGCLSGNPKHERAKPAAARCAGQLRVSPDARKSTVGNLDSRSWQIWIRALRGVLLPAPAQPGVAVLVSTDLLDCCPPDVAKYVIINGIALH